MWGTKHELGDVSPCLVACKCCVAESSVGAGAAVADLLLSDAILAHASPRKCSGAVLAAAWVLAAYEMLSSSFALSDHAQMLASAVAQSAAWMLALRALSHSASDAVSAHVAPRNAAHLFRRQSGCLQRMGHEAGALRCSTTTRCRQMLCHRAQRGCWCCMR